MDWLMDLAPNAQVTAITVLGVVGMAIFTFFGVFLNLLSRWQDRTHKQRLSIRQKPKTRVQVRLSSRAYAYGLQQSFYDPVTFISKVNYLRVFSLQASSIRLVRKLRRGWQYYRKR